MAFTTDSHLVVSGSRGVLTLTLNRPDSLNSLTPELLDDVRRQLAKAENDPAVRCVVITGAGRSFSSGQALGGKKLSTREVLEQHYNPLVTTIVEFDKPVIAAINGVAAGAAASLTLACDLRIMTDDARLIFLFTRVGLVADAGATWFLPRLVGPATATELFMLGRDVPATEAVDMGLVHRAVPHDELDDVTTGLAEHLASGPASIGLFKRQLRASASNTLEQQLAVEVDTQELATSTEDYQEGVAAFLDKRTARFTGR